MDNTTHSIDSGRATQSQGAPGAGYAPRPAANRRGTPTVVWLLIGLAALALCAAATTATWFVGIGSIFNKVTSVTVGELQVESKSIPQGSAESVAVNVNMGYGTLTLAGGAADLLDAGFSYNIDIAKPVVTYSESGTKGTLKISQPGMEGFIRTADGVRNEWDLRLKDGTPLTLTGSLGAGTSTIKLDGLSVSELDLTTGAGDVTLDLTGNWKQDLDATLHAGIGETTIRLPKDVGVRVEVEGGISNVESGGFSRDGRYYTNSAYGKTPVTLEINVETGIGNVKIEPER